MTAPYHYNFIMDQCLKAADRGLIVHSGLRREWNIAGNCENPYTVEMYGRTPDNLGGKGVLIAPGHGKAMLLEMQVRCRKCLPCRKAKAKLWTWRAVQETIASPRSWFGTLTVNPAQRFLIVSGARQLAAERAVQYDHLDDAGKFEYQSKVAGKELTKWIKRVRANSGATLRYCLVSERHKSGDPHWHVLCHEVKEDQRVSWRELSNAWHWGFTNFTVVKSPHHAASYVAKYISKSLQARVRASQAYGAFIYERSFKSVYTEAQRDPIDTPTKHSQF